MKVLLFDIRPKKRRVDLYDFDEEYGRFVKCLGEPLIVVRGLRRTGKTSLILTGLEETRAPYVLVDFREPCYSRRDLYTVLSRSLSVFASRISGWGRVFSLFKSVFSSIRGISIYGFQVSISWGKGRPLLTDVFRSLDYLALKTGLKVAIVLDEVQKLVGRVKFELLNAIAYAFDYMENISFILSGSEMGLLYGILDNLKSPLYGRAHVTIETRKFSKKESEDFLIKGFTELNMRVSGEEIEEAVETLDGIVGWLTYYGYSKHIGGESLGEIRRKAVELAREELENFLKQRVSRRRYILVMKALARGVKEWGRLKNHLEKAEEKPISERVLYDILATLKKHSIINDKLEYTDPVVKEAAKNL